MSITLIGDAHGHMHELQGIQRHISKGRSIQLGDVGFGFREIPEFGSQHKFIRGNHDDPAKAAAHPQYLGDFGYLPEDDLFYVSGAFSIDWVMRTEGRSWWREEELSPARLQEAIDLYKQVKPGRVISHECPSKANEALLKDLLGAYFYEKGALKKSRTCQALQRMFEIHEPGIWIFGHYHITKQFKIGRTTFQCLAELATFELSTPKDTVCS